MWDKSVVVATGRLLGLLELHEAVSQGQTAMKPLQETAISVDLFKLKNK